MPCCLLWKRVPGYTIPMVPMHLPPMAPMNRVEQIRALVPTGMERAHQQNDSLVNGYRWWVVTQFAAVSIAQHGMLVGLTLPLQVKTPLCHPNHRNRLVSCRLRLLLPFHLRNRLVVAPL
jgi:hypothetical protein